MRTPIPRSAKEEARSFALNYVQRVMDETCAWGDVRYEPVKVVLDLGAPTLMTHPWLAFDSLCLSLMVQEFSGQEIYHVWQRKFSFDQAIMDAINILGVKQQYPWPVKRRPDGLQHASVSLFEPQFVQPRTVTLFKRFETFHAPTGTRKQKVARAMEFYRDYAMNFIALPVTRCIFFAMAFPPMLERLMSALVGIGTHFRDGFGAVRRWKIEPTQEDESVTYQGVAMRPIPVRMLDGYDDTAMLAWRPPYWGAESVEECCVPFTKATLLKQEVSA